MLTRTAEHQNNKNEDAITSMIFTPLRFMSTHDVFACLIGILPGLSARVAARSISSVRVELWPSIAVGNTRIEPDLRAVLQFADGGSLVLLGEMKWESSIAAEQLRREKTCVDANSGYIFAIVKSRGAATAQGLGCNELRTWKEIHRSVRELSASHLPTSSVEDWAILVAGFLQIAEQLVFGGFDDIATSDLPSADQREAFFSRTHLNKHFEFTPSEIALDEGFAFYNRRIRS